MKNKTFFSLFLSISFFGIEILSTNLPAKAADGCGQKHHLSYIAPNNPTGASFLTACNNHDNCYDTPGAQKDSCDENFKHDANDSCARTFRGFLQYAQKEICYGVVKTYSSFFQTQQSHQAYDDAQAAARARVVALPVRTIPTSPVSQKPVGSYWDDKVSVFYSSGDDTYCKFANPQDLDRFSPIHPAPVIQAPFNFKQTLRYTGTCYSPVIGYWDDKISVFYSSGNGVYCGFANPQDLQSFSARHPAPVIKQPFNFRGVLSYTGHCPSQ